MSLHDNEIVMYYLKMSKGKMCAQIGHATVNMMLRLKNNDNILKLWYKTGQKKIILQSNEKDMQDLYNHYKSDNLIWCMKTVDQGLTQIPEGSFTVLCFTPHYKNKFNDVKILQAKLM